MLLVGGLAWWWMATWRTPGPGSGDPVATDAPAAGARQPAAPATGGAGSAKGTPEKRVLSAAEKQARIEQIKKDYNEVRAKAAAERLGDRVRGAREQTERVIADAFLSPRGTERNP